MSHLEQAALCEAPRLKDGPKDGGFGIFDAISEGLRGGLDDLHKAQCAFLNARPAEAVLPKVEIGKDGKGEYLLFGAADRLSDGKSHENPHENVRNFDEWLDDKTRLQKQAAA